jgi:hypothetical protein
MTKKTMDCSIFKHLPQSTHFPSFKKMRTELSTSSVDSFEDVFGLPSVTLHPYHASIILYCLLKG